MKYFVSVKTRNGSYKAFKVKEEVYIYVKQLEIAVKYPEDSKLTEAYPERFSQNPERFRRK